jgi:hypothetical protein
MKRALLTLLLIVTAPAVVSAVAAVLQSTIWLTAVLLLPVYAVLFELIQP